MTQMHKQTVLQIQKALTSYPYRWQYAGNFLKIQSCLKDLEKKMQKKVQWCFMYIMFCSGGHQKINEETRETEQFLLVFMLILKVKSILRSPYSTLFVITRGGTYRALTITVIDSLIRNNFLCPLLLFSEAAGGHPWGHLYRYSWVAILD